jgi:hypothetical protein
MVLEKIRWKAQRRPSVSKLRAKGLSDFQSSEAVVEAARWRSSGPWKKVTFMTYLLKEGRAEQQLFT